MWLRINAARYTSAFTYFLAPLTRKEESKGDITGTLKMPRDLVMDFPEWVDDKRLNGTLVRLRKP